MINERVSDRIIFFYTIPVKLDNVSEDEFFDSMNLMPLVGILIGLLLWLAGWLVWFIGYPAGGAVLMMAVPVVYRRASSRRRRGYRRRRFFSQGQRQDVRDHEGQPARLLRSGLADHAASDSVRLLPVDDLELYRRAGSCSGYRKNRGCQAVSWSEPAQQGGGLGKGFCAVTKPWLPVLYGILLFAACWAF